MTLGWLAMGPSRLTNETSGDPWEHRWHPACNGGGMARTKYNSPVDTLYDSDTNERLNADDLKITGEQYLALIDESIECPQPEGHVRAPNGRRVYAR